MAEQQGDPAAAPRDPYTIHDDTDATGPAVEPGPEPEPAAQPEARPGRTRRGPDPVALVAGLAAVLVAVLALTDTLTALDGRWLVAGGAIVIGVIVLAVASRPRARQDR